MRYFVFALLLLAGLAQAQTVATPVDPAEEKKLVAAVQNAMKSYNALLKSELGMTRKNAVQVEISTDREDFRNRLLAHRASNAIDMAKTTVGTMSLDEHLMIVLLSQPVDQRQVNHRIAHTLTFSLQHDLSSGSSQRARPWIREGMRDYVATMLLHKMGEQSFENWKLESVNTLRQADDYPMPLDMINTDDRNWDNLTQKSHRTNYQMADLMMSYLYEQKGVTFFGELANYYRCLANGFTREKTCFTENLGIEPELFAAQAQKWVIETLAKTGGLDVVANGQDAIAAEVSKVYSTQQALLEEKLGRKLGITLRIHLSRSSAEMAEQIVDQLGGAKEGAAKLSNSSAWFSSGSTWFINTTMTDTPERRAALIGQMVMGSYLESRAENMNPMYWFYVGLNDWMSAQLLEKLGLRTAAQTLALRKAVLSDAQKGLPKLAELTSRNAWRKAETKYGRSVVIAVAAEASHSLLKKEGEVALEQWIESNMPVNSPAGGPASAFTLAFGQSTDAYIEAFDNPQGTNDFVFNSVRDAKKSYYDLLKSQLGLEQQDVAIELSANREDLANRLASHDYPDPTNAARTTLGFSLYKEHRIIVALYPGDNVHKINRTVVQNLAAILQYDLSKGKIARAKPWIRAGMSHYISYFLLQNMGGQSFEKQKLESINALRLTDSYPTPQDLVNLKNTDWSAARRKSPDTHDLVVDLMMAYLYEKKQDKLFSELADYFGCLSQDDTSEARCFSKYFGVDPEQFISELQVWFTETLAHTGGVEVVANGQETIAIEIKKAYASEQELLEEKLGRKLEVTPRIHLSKTFSEMEQQIIKELGAIKLGAVPEAASGLFSSENLWFINTSLINTPEQRAHFIGTMVMASYLETRAENITSMYWLYAGLNDWMSTQLLEKIKLRPLEQSTLLRHSLLNNAEKGLPTLAELTTSSSWRAAQKKYGRTVVIQVAAEAVHALLKKSGEAAIENWIESNLALNGSADGPDSAFAHAFGESPNAFVKKFKLVTPLHD